MVTDTTSRPRVLVADDDESILRLVSTVIRRSGIEVDSAADGEQAIDKIEQHDYSVILLDLMMPKIDGFGVVDYLRQHPAPYKPVVLVVTAYADQQFKKVDPDIVAGVLRKPFDVADLEEIVASCVKSYERARSMPASDDDTVRILPPSAEANLRAIRRGKKDFSH